jgi:hypothetical protein
MRLVPDMTVTDTLAKFKAHLAKHGFRDLEVNERAATTRRRPTRTAAVRWSLPPTALGVQPELWPRSAGSWPGYVFTDAPLSLPAGHFGLGYGTGAHAPDEFYVIESPNPKVQGMDGAVGSFVEFLYALA